jgi:poly-beta-hydroxyalkanoate depolymerase
MSALGTALHHQTYPGLADVMAAMRFIKQHHLQATVGHCGVFTRKRWDQ